MAPSPPEFLSSKPANSLSEKDLARLVDHGDYRGQKELYDRYAGQLTAVARRYLADDEAVKDVLQDAFISIYQKIGSFRYRGEGSLRAWVTRIVVNGALQQLRREKKHSDVDLLPDMPDEPFPETEGIPSGVLQQMIEALPEGYRTVFNLYVFEDKSHKEIASLLGIKENSSASQLLRAKARLAQEIKEYRKEND